jgi:membrane protein implicated in regulation of membrane protease activity
MQIFYFYLIIGIIFIALDIVSTTFYLFVIGAAFILSSLLALAINNWLIITLFWGVLSIIGCILIRIYKKRLNNSKPSVISHIGQQVEVIEILDNKLRVAYSGSYWNAKLAKKDITNIKVGDTLTIIKYNNNELELD